MHTTLGEKNSLFRSWEATPPSQEQVPSHKTMVSSLGDMLAVAAESRLLQSPYSELHHVTCEWVQGVVVLRGRVSRYYLKQVAQTIVSQVVGVDDIDNQLKILPIPIYAR